MNRDRIDAVAAAVLYEGYSLYPYRPSMKNAQRWTFGGLYPQACAAPIGEHDAVLTQILVEGSAASVLDVELRFLHLIDRRVGELPEPAATWDERRLSELRWVPTREVAGQIHHAWQEAAERRLATGPFPLAEILDRPRRFHWSLPGRCWTEPLTENDRVPAVLAYRQQPLDFELLASIEPVKPGLFRVTLEAVNRTPAPASLRRDEALLSSLVSTHLLLSVGAGNFVSLIDPPPEHREDAAACRSLRCWPVLAGDPPARDAMLVSPIILYDYPQVAPESPGDLFDCTEVDEILSLRIATLTDDEQRSVLGTDGRTAALLRRTQEVVCHELSKLHGAIRQPFQPGDRVRIKPRPGGDVFDIALAGLTARVSSVETDLEGRPHVAVVVEDDPGRELGLTGQPGHRFFFKPEELCRFDPQPGDTGVLL